MMGSLRGRPNPGPGQAVQALRPRAPRPGGDAPDPEGDGSRRDSRRDILQDDRERRSRSRFRYLHPGTFLSGRFGAVVLAVFLAGGLGWFLYENFSGVFSPRPAPAPQPAPAHPEAGRVLSPVEHTLASVFGAPLFLGDRGLPVIRVPATGEVREMTPVEVEYDEPFRFVASGYRDAIWGPGPRGWGIFWEDDSELRSLAPVARFTRESWRERQQDELHLVLEHVEVGMELISLGDPSRWRPGLGRALFELSEDVRGRYPPVEYGHWGSVPGLWVCDLEAEQALTQGLTLGCPDVEYLERLIDVWVSLGVVVDQLGVIGLVMARLEGMDSMEQSSSGVGYALAYQVQDLERMLDRVQVSVDALWQQSAEDELPLFLGGD